MFSDIMLSQPVIKEKFNEALDIMNRAVSSGMGWYSTLSQKRNNISCFLFFHIYTFIRCDVSFSLHSQVDICNLVQGRILHI